MFHEVSSSDDEALGFCLLASALLAPTEAQQAAERANELLPKALDLAARIESEINAAYLPARWITAFFPRSVADLIGTAKRIRTVPVPAWECAFGPRQLVSVHTTEHNLGCQQKLRRAVNATTRASKTFSRVFTALKRTSGPRSVGRRAWLVAGKVGGL